MFTEQLAYICHTVAHVFPITQYSWPVLSKKTECEVHSVCKASVRFRNLKAVVAKTKHSERALCNSIRFPHFLSIMQHSISFFILQQRILDCYKRDDLLIWQVYDIDKAQVYMCIFQIKRVPITLLFYFLLIKAQLHIL